MTAENRDQEMLSLPCHHYVQFFLKKEVILPMVSYIQQIFKMDDSFSTLEFTQVAMKTLTHFDGLSNDLYIRLGGDEKPRYIKYLGQGDRVTLDDVMRKKEKGVESLYLKRLAAKWILTVVNDHIEQVIQSKDGDFVLDLSHIDMANENIANPQNVAAHIKTEMPIIDESVKNALKLDDQFIHQVHVMTKRSLAKVKRLPKLEKFLSKIEIVRDKKNFFNNRLWLTISISCSLARNLDWGTEPTLEKLIFSSYLHDCILVDAPHLAQLRSLEEFNEISQNLSMVEKKLFLEHPKIIARMIEDRNDIAHDIYSMVLQHHELPDRSGFPEKLVGNKIIPIASLFIISIDLATTICNDEDWGLESFILKGKEKYKTQHFRRVLASLEKIAKNMVTPTGKAAA